MATLEFQEQFGPWALITGASSGLGQSFARKLAAKGLNVVLTSRSEKKLRALAEELQDDYGVETRVIAIDLCQRDSVDALYIRCADLKIGLVVSNAGAAQMLNFMNYSLDAIRESTQLNVNTHIDIARYFGKSILDRGEGRGGLLFMSSIIGFQGAPYLSIYGASKSHILSFAEALHYENRNKGLHVTAVAAGPVKTPMMHMNKLAKKVIRRSKLTVLDPSRVTDGALDALQKNTPVYIPGILMRWQFGFIRRYFNTRSMGVKYWGKAIKRYMKIYINIAAQSSD